MSFILDALRKSDKKRPDGEVPDLRAEHLLVPPRTSRRGMLIGVVIVLVLLFNGAMWLWWAAPWEEELQVVSHPVSASRPAPERTPAEPAPQAVPEPVVENPKPAQQTLQSEAGPTAVADPVETVAAVEPVTVGQTVIVPGSGTLPTEQDSPGESSPEPIPVVGKDPLPFSLSALPALSAAQSVADPVAAVKSAPESKEVTAPDIYARDSSPDEAPVAGKPVALRDLPSSIRAGLPDFSFSLHYFTTDPAQRVVRVNGRMLREGQMLREDLLLDEVTPGGAVFLHRDLRFEVVRY